MSDFSTKLDNLIGTFWPERAYKRKMYRFAYDAIDKSRTRRKRNASNATGDSDLTESALSDLRDIARDQGRNNPIIKGMLQTERDGVIGSRVKINANTSSKQFNDRVDKLWLEEMIARPCDSTGRFNINQIVRKGYLSYRRDGDFALKFNDDDIEAIEGPRIGTPIGISDTASYDVVNGIAFSKQTGKVIGYFIGKPDKWGYIQPGSYKKVVASKVHHIFNPDMFSFSRGEPILTSSIKYTDKLDGLIDAELTASMVNACFSMAITRNDDNGAPYGYTEGISSTGKDNDGNTLEKLEPGSIMYLNPGESAQGIGQMSPGSMFDPFALRIMSLIGRPMCMPLMLITLDFSGATFMNARIAYQKVQELWMTEQNDIVYPTINKIWRWKIDQLIRRGEIKDRSDKYSNQFIPNRWPYVDPSKESKADEQQLKNGTTTRTIICERQGQDFVDINNQRIKEEESVYKPEPIESVEDNKNVQSTDQ